MTIRPEPFTGDEDLDGWHFEVREAICDLQANGGGGSGNLPLDHADPNDLISTGSNTHSQIDTHIQDGTIHFTEDSIDHGALQGLADDDHTQYNRKDTLTAKGDIYAATVASTPDNLAVGTDDQLLVAASGESTGLKWEDISNMFSMQVAFDADYRDFDMWVLTNTALNGNNQIELAAQ